MESAQKLHVVRKAKKITSRTITYIGATVIAVLFIFPLVWMLATSAKTEMQYANDLGSFATFLPNFSDLSTFFDNYASVLTEYDIWTFADGTIVKTVHRHRLYNIDRQAMVNMDEWKISWFSSGW